MLVKCRNPSPAYQQTMDMIVVAAVDDEEYYGSQNRPAGMMHPADEANATEPTTGTIYGGNVWVGA